MDSISLCLGTNATLNGKCKRRNFRKIIFFHMLILLSVCECVCFFFTFLYFLVYSLQFFSIFLVHRIKLSSHNNLKYVLIQFCFIQMSKTIRTLEKETKTWKEKFENANVALCQMFNERTKMEANLESQKKQNLQLQSLCRALQKQTRELRSQLKAQGIIIFTIIFFYY